MTRFWRRGPVADRGTPPAKTAPKLPFDVAQAPPMLAEIIDHVEEGALLLIGTEVRWLNPAARLMFPDIEHPVGRPLVEVVRDHRIDGLALRARESGLEHAAEVELPRTDRILQIRAVPSQDGALILLARDVTRLRYLETVRQQFVANLSHEIRTPLAGLDLAAQTLSAQLPAEGDTRLFIDRVEVTVRDTGPGIPSRDLSRIFERFYMVDRSRGGLPGSGLGLSIARHLVELQGGTIVAESSGGSGTIVRVRLPRDPLTSP